jgi:outer membrane lipoprotein-sorting protein
VSELGDLLELLYRARSSWRTVHMETREWTHYERAKRAFERFNARTETARATGAVQLTGGGATPVETSSLVCTWVDDHGRYREERDDGGYPMTRVSDGVHSWTYSPTMGAIVQDDAAGLENELLDPTPLIAALELEVLGQRDYRGRAAIDARGLPRNGRRFGPPAVPPGADDIRLVVDLERGVVLRKEARLDGQPFSVREVLELSFDEEPPAGTFVFEPPPGEEIRSAEEAFHAEHLTIEEAARRCAFTVYAPSNLAGNWRVFAVYRTASERPPLPESVDLVLHDDALHHVLIEESPERSLAWRDDSPRVIPRDGVELRVFEGRQPGPPAEVQLERNGTHVRVSSDNLPAETLVDVAAALAPAPTEPPPIVA